MQFNDCKCCSHSNRSKHLLFGRLGQAIAFCRFACRAIVCASASRWVLFLCALVKAIQQLLYWRHMRRLQQAPVLLWESDCRQRPVQKHVDAARWLVQTAAVVEAMQTTTWRARTQLGRFKNGKWYIHLELLHGPPILITPACVLSDTWCEHMPLHVTLGHSNSLIDVDAVKQLVNGYHDVKLEKWSWRRERSTYIVRGALEACCKRCEQFGFRPAGEWHLSL